MEPTLRLESPAQPDVVALLQRAADYLLARYPAESCRLMDVAALQAPGVRFWVARQAGQAVGCCALVPLTEAAAEIKRLYVDEPARGHGLGTRLLETVERAACELGLTTLLLEAGVRQPEALALYGKRGYTRRGRFGEHGDDPLSVFLEKSLRAPADSPTA